LGSREFIRGLRSSDEAGFGLAKAKTGEFVIIPKKEDMVLKKIFWVGNAHVPCQKKANNRFRYSIG
jgi:urease accessory protein UreE